MDYRTMVSGAKKAGVTNDDKMWQSIALIGSHLDALKDAHPEQYWNLMREQYGILYNNHYGEDFANYDVDKMYSTDKQGNHYHGAHWTKEEILDATKNKVFRTGTTDCDKYVAYNAMWHDLHKALDDGQILESAYLFFFADEDSEIMGSKIWNYMMIGK